MQLLTAIGGAERGGDRPSAEAFRELAGKVAAQVSIRQFAIAET